MLGEKAYQNALRRRAELRQELQDIESFLLLCERFAGDDAPVSASGYVPPLPPQFRVDGGAVEVGGNALRPHIRKAILDVGRPLSRGDTVRALNERGIRVPGQDPATNVGTIMWRAKDEFVHIKPHGYWPRDVPYAAAGYNPAGGTQEHVQDDNSASDGGDDPPVHSAASNGTSRDLWGS